MSISPATRAKIIARGGIPLKCKRGEFLFNSDQYHYWRAEYRDVDITGEVIELSKWLAKKPPDERPDKSQVRWIVGGWLKRKHRG